MYAILMQGAWFCRLAPDFRAALLADARMVRLTANAPIFWRGDAADGLYAVLEGAVEIGAVDSAGRAAILTHVQAGTWFGEIAILDGMPRTHDAHAARATVLLHIPRAPLLALLDREPAWWRALAWLATEKLRLSFQLAEANALLDAPQQVAARLLLIAGGHAGTGMPQSTLRLSQEQLATMVALSRQTVNRILNRFEAMGAVALRTGAIEIRDPLRLQSFCQGGAQSLLDPPV
jgi:CRP-like cAMP-binding protein